MGYSSIHQEWAEESWKKCLYEHERCRPKSTHIVSPGHDKHTDNPFIAIDDEVPTHLLQREMSLCYLSSSPKTTCRPETIYTHKRSTPNLNSLLIRNNMCISFSSLTRIKSTTPSLTPSSLTLHIRGVQLTHTTNYLSFLMVVNKLLGPHVSQAAPVWLQKVKHQTCCLVSKEERFNSKLKFAAPHLPQ